MRQLASVFLCAFLLVHACRAGNLCFERAGRDYNIHPLILQAIAIKESRLNNKAVNSKNYNGSTDLCAMQINSSNFDKLRGNGVSPQMLIDDPCMCVYAGAWILAGFIQVMGNNWDAVGAYNAGAKNTPEAKARRKSYSDNVKAIYAILLKYSRR